MKSWIGKSGRRSRRKDLRESQGHSGGVAGSRDAGRDRMRLRDDLSSRKRELRHAAEQGRLNGSISGESRLPDVSRECGWANERALAESNDQRCRRRSRPPYVPQPHCRSKSGRCEMDLTDDGAGTSAPAPAPSPVTTPPTQSGPPPPAGESGRMGSTMPNPRNPEQTMRWNEDATAVVPSGSRVDGWLHR